MSFNWTSLRDICNWFTDISNIFTDICIYLQISVNKDLMWKRLAIQFRPHCYFRCASACLFASTWHPWWVWVSFHTVLCCDNYFSSSSVVSRAFSALSLYSKFGHHPHPLGNLCAKFCFFRGLRWLRGTAVERQSLASKLSLSCARPAVDG